MSSYANSADKINDKINMLNQKQFDDIADFETAANENQQTKLNQEYERYMKKYDEVKSIGEDDIAGLFGLKGAYQGFKKIKGVYNKYRNTGSGDDVNDLGNYIDRTVVTGKEIKNPAFDPDSLTSTASDAAQNTGTSDVSQIISQATNNASKAVSSASNAASQATSDASNAASQATSDVSNAASQATSDVSNAASQASNAVSNATSDVNNAFSNFGAGDASNPYSLTTFLKKIPDPTFVDAGVDPSYNLKLPKSNIGSTNVDDARASMKAVKLSDDNQGDSLQPMRNLIKQTRGQKVTPSQVKAAQNAAKNAQNASSDATADASNAASSAASDASNAASSAASDASNAASSAASDASNAASSAASDASNAVSNAASNASNAVSNAVSDASNAAKNLVSAQAKNALQMSKASISGTEAAGDGALDTIGEVAESSGILDAIPVLGEAAAVAGGLFAIGDGLYHLFHHSHHDAPAPVPVTLQGNVLQQQLTSKYASALPSMDSANDHASNMF